MIRVGVVDVGTNSVRSLIADSDGRAVRDVERTLEITRLGQGVDAARALAPEPLRRTVAAIAASVERCRVAGAAAVRVFATSAVRDAANRDAFVRAVEAATRVAPAVLSGEEEARLGFAGATASATVPPPLLVVDVGGGSTELIVGVDRPDAWVSLDIGSVRLTERHVRHDPPEGAEVEAVRADARAHIEQGVARVGRRDELSMIGLAGTFTVAAAILLDLERYDRARVHGATLPLAEVEALRARLAGMTSARRRELPVMQPGREDVIVSGLLIVEEVMRAFGCSSCTVSESDILDGAALALARAAMG